MEEGGKRAGCGGGRPQSAGGGPGRDGTGPAGRSTPRPPGDGARGAGCQSLYRTSVVAGGAARSINLHGFLFFTRSERMAAAVET